MRNDLTSEFLVEMVKDHRTPIVLMVVHFEFGDVYLADRDIVISGRLYEGIVSDWGKLATVGDENGVSGTMEQTITLWNGGDEPFSNYFFSEDPVNVFVDLYQTFDDLEEVDFAHIGEFVIQDPIEYSEASSLLVMDLVTSNMRYFGQVGSLLTKGDYPYALEGDLNKPINLIVGDVGELECICSNKPASTTLIGSILKNPTKVYSLDSLDELGFTNIGFIQIDDEIMSYDSRTDSYFNVITRGYLTIVSDHSDGSEIIQALQPIEYIVGQGPLTSVSNVKVKGQDPTIPYTIDITSDPATITFNSQPTYAEYSRGARSLDEDFDSAGADNTARRPDYAFDSAQKSKGAIINGTEYDRLSVLQQDQQQDEGEIVKVFLCVDHWATKAYFSDRVDIYVDGIGAIGFLNRPNEDDIIEVGGEVDLDHGHDHKIGGNHDHGNLDPNFAIGETPHPHPVESGVNRIVQGTPYNVYFGYHSFSNESRLFSYNFNFAIASIPTASNAASIKITFAMSDTTGAEWTDYVQLTVYYYIGGWTQKASIYDSNPGRGKTYELVLPNWDRGQSSTGYDIYINAKAALNNGDFGSVYADFTNPILFVDGKIITTSAVNTNASTYKNQDGNVYFQNVDSSGLSMKDQADVDALAEANRQLDITLSENSSRSVTQKFDITQYLETIDWDWTLNRKVYLQYVGGIEDVQIVVTYINFEIEYRQRKIRSTDEITCSAVGSIESRPDAVIQYLLTEKAGLPESKIGSVIRNIPKWDDTDIWDDTEIWQDEGQVSGVPPGALFEEAGAWFDYHNYTIDGIIEGDLSIKEAIKNLTWQTRSRIVWQNGLVQLVILRKNDEWIIAKNLTTDDIQLKSIISKRSPSNEIVNKIDLFHTIDRLSDAEGGAQFSATSEVKDQISINKNGLRVDDSLWLFDLVRNQAMADSIADYYLWLLGETTTYYELIAYLNSFDLEKEDYITIDSSHLFAINNLPTVLKEVARDYGNGKQEKINTLNLIAQSIRHKFFRSSLEDNVNTLDLLNIDFGSSLFFDDPVNVEDNFLLQWGKDFEDTVSIADNFIILVKTGSLFTETLLTSDSLGAEISIPLSDQVIATENLELDKALCFGACGFGQLPFGSPTSHAEAPVDNASFSDDFAVLISREEEEELQATDNLVFSDGFGCPSGLGDGFGKSPFGC